MKLGIKDINGVELSVGDRIVFCNLPEDSYTWTEYQNGMEGAIKFNRGKIGLYDDEGEWMRHWNDGVHIIGFEGFGEYEEYVKKI